MGITLIHRSPNEFVFPCRDKMKEHSRESFAPHLGLYCAYNDSHSTIGGFKYILEMEEDTKCGLLPISRFSKLGRDEDQFSEIEIWKSKGFDVMNVIESNGAAEIAIVVNFDKIKSFSLSK